jgi:glycine betaine catabolism A
MYAVAHIDYVRVVSLKPLGPERTRLTAEWLFPKSTLEAPGFDLGHVTGFATMVMKQDADACETNQRGLKSSAFRHGRLMPQEFDVYNFQQWVRKHCAM